MGTDFQDLMFTKREKQGILQILEFLEPFKAATDALQGEHYPTLLLVTPAVDELIQVCRPAERTQRNDCSQLNIEDDDIVEQSSFDHDQEVGYLGLPMDNPNCTEEDFGLEELKSKVSSALHQRFPQNLIFKLASALDYRLKGDPSVIGTLPEFMEAIDHFNAVFKLQQGGSSSHSSDSTEERLPVPQTSAAKSKEKAGYSSFFTKRHAKGPRSDAQDSATDRDITHEINSYLALSNPTKEEAERLDLLTWWKEHESAFPRLSQIAKIVLFFVATSAPSERVFSSAGNKVSAQRSQLAPELVNMMTFVQGNFRYNHRIKSSAK